MRYKRVVSCMLALTGMGLLILNGPIAVAGAQAGLELCLKAVIPSLFPFFFFSNILVLSLFGYDNTFLNGVGRLFSLPIGASSLLVPAFLGGYPAGAQTVADLYKRNLLEKEEAERLLAFTNNAGPSFIFGMVAPAFTDYKAAWVIWFSQILGALIVSVLFHPRKTCYAKTNASQITISEAMSSAVTAIAKVCGWVILFRVFISFLDCCVLQNRSPELKVLSIGLLELSNGCALLREVPNESIRLILANTMVSWGGVCVTLQTKSVVNNLSLRKYYAGKAVQIAAGIFLSVSIVSGKSVFIISIVLLLMFFALFQKRSSISGRVGV